jgi:hypothetical protein
MRNNDRLFSNGTAKLYNRILIIFIQLFTIKQNASIRIICLENVIQYLFILPAGTKPELDKESIGILAILSAIATLSVTGFNVMDSVGAQMTGDNATSSGNMTEVRFLFIQGA